MKSIKAASQALADAIDAGAVLAVMESMPDHFSTEAIEEARLNKKAMWAKVPTMADFGFDPRPPK